MKKCSAVLVACLGFSADIAAEAALSVSHPRLMARRGHRGPHASLLAHVLPSQDAPRASDGPQLAHFGDTACPCIGFDNVEGTTLVSITGGENQEVAVEYPSDLGARCEAWDDGRYPFGCKEGQLPGLGNSFCSQPWCFVDSCNCKMDELPKMTQYLPEVFYRGKPIYFSYQTCGGKDYFSQDRADHGKKGCRCIGFEHMEGSMEYVIGERLVTFPAVTGGTCQAWDHGRHPLCTSKYPPSWCVQPWCYVNPCECDLRGKAAPKVSSYLPNSTFMNLPVFYSYETCNGADLWTGGNEKACVNQDNKKDCLAREACGWTKGKCMGKELADPRLCKREIKGQHRSTAAGVRAARSAVALLAALAAAAGATLAASF